MHGPAYEPLGAWWTFDAPSLRVPDAAHGYVSIWSTGNNGPSVLLVHRSGTDHREWEPILPLLVENFVVSALDVGPGSVTTSADANSIRTAACAVGADLIVAHGDAAAAVLLGAPSGTGILLWEPPGDISDSWHERFDVVSADQEASSIPRPADARPYRLANIPVETIAEVLRQQAGIATAGRPDEGTNG